MVVYKENIFILQLIFIVFSSNLKVDIFTLFTFDTIEF